MANNSSIPVASGNETFANEDIGGVKFPQPKVQWGPVGTANTVDVATGKPLPVQLRSSNGTDLIGTAGTASAAVITVQGIASGTAQPVSIASVPSHAVTNAGTFAVQAAVTAASGALASGSVASGALASGSVASGAFASGSIGSGAVASGAVASGAIASGAVASGAFASGSLAVGSVTAGAIAAGTASFVKLEDAPFGDGDAVAMVGMMRASAPANTSGSNLDVEPLQGLNGRLWTDSYIGDGTNHAAIKAASTAPVASDPAIVVAISPNSVNSNGRKTDILSAPVVLASQTYETVAASQTAQVMGGSGASGDFISHILVVPANLNPGNILLLDNATSITVFTGGTGSVTTLHPFTIAISAVSASGAWKITTGASVSCMAVGNFT